MEISFDPVKRAVTLEKRGLDFADAGLVFAGVTFTRPDDRFDYPEPRFQTFGRLHGRMVTIAWAGTEQERRIISMRKCNEREQERIGRELG